MKKSRTVRDDSSRLAREAKAIVALAFRNGPIEDVHAGKSCPTCDGKAGYSHITDGEMLRIMKSAVDHNLYVSGSQGTRRRGVRSAGETRGTLHDGLG
jgi:hypothetical protein